MSQIAYSLCPDVNLMKNANSTFAYVSKRTIYNTSWNAKWISLVIQARSSSSSTISILYIVSPSNTLFFLIRPYPFSSSCFRFFFAQASIANHCFGISSYPGYIFFLLYRFLYVCGGVISPHVSDIFIEFQPSLSYQIQENLTIILQNKSTRKIPEDCTNTGFRHFCPLFKLSFWFDFSCYFIVIAF